MMQGNITCPELKSARFVLTVNGLVLLLPAVEVFSTNPTGSVQDVFSAVIEIVALFQPLNPVADGKVGTVAVIASDTPPLFWRYTLSVIPVPGIKPVMVNPGAVGP
jgi:hypothetical protein